jgi:DNA-binding Xre family transcriptional regulator
MKWNLRLAAASRGIWKASELQKMLAGRGLLISAGKMSGLWSGSPNAVKLADLNVICAVLGCEIGELLIPEPVPEARAAPDATPAVVPRRRNGRSLPPRCPRRHRRQLPDVPVLGHLVCRRVPGLLRLRPPPRTRPVRVLPPAPAAEEGLLPQLLAAGRRDREKAPDLGPADFAAVRWHQLSFAAWPG